MRMPLWRSYIPLVPDAVVNHWQVLARCECHRLGVPLHCKSNAPTSLSFPLPLLPGTAHACPPLLGQSTTSFPLFSGAQTKSHTGVIRLPDHTADFVIWRPGLRLGFLGLRNAPSLSHGATEETVHESGAAHVDTLVFALYIVYYAEHRE